MLDDIPSLRPQVETAIAKSYQDAKRTAVAETRLDNHNFPAYCPFPPEQMLDEDFLPE